MGGGLSQAEKEAKLKDLVQRIAQRFEQLKNICEEGT
jgi:hypothetical protein